MSTLTLELPTFWACPLAYGDTSGLTDEDEAALDAFIADNPNLSFASIEDGEGSFRWRHDASRYGVLACNVADFVFIIREET